MNGVHLTFVYHVYELQRVLNSEWVLLKILLQKRN